MRASPLIRRAPVRRCSFLAVAALTLALVATTLSSQLGLPVVHAQVPGPELFAKDPKTPIELWDAIDYLIRTNQVKKAVPYLDKFVKSKPDDSTLVGIRDRFGYNTFLKLNDDPGTLPFAQPITQALIDATRRYAVQPDRIARFVAELTQTPEEQDYAVRRLREAGPFAIPPLVAALEKPGLSSTDRDSLARNIAKLGRSAAPALIATLDSPDPVIATIAANALGSIGEPGAVPFLTFLAASTTTPAQLRSAAHSAIARLNRSSLALTGFPGQTPAQTLTAAALRYHRHQVEFADGPVTIWTWDKDKNIPTPRDITRTEAEALFGLKLAREALRLDPTSVPAQVAQLSLALDKAIERVGLIGFLDKDQATAEAAIAAGPAVLGKVLETAIADRKYDLAAAAASLLSNVTTPDDLSKMTAPTATAEQPSVTSQLRPHPLVRALDAPGRRVQFAAAKALVELAPKTIFPGSSRVVPALARFLVNEPLPRAVVIDANPTRGSQLAGLLVNLGYDSELELTGKAGFQAAAAMADTELILVSFDLFTGWSLTDTLSNLQADGRTAGIPIYVYGPYDIRFKRPNLVNNFPGIRYLVQPLEPATLERQLGGRPVAVSEPEHNANAREAAALLARIAADRSSPFVSDLDSVEPTLSVALGFPETAQAATDALSNLPDPDAQRSLAALVLDTSRPAAARAYAAEGLARAIQRFGPLVSAAQEARFARETDDETDLQLRAGVSSVIKALRASPPARTNRLRTNNTPVATPPTPRPGGATRDS
jgi:HEAT repeats